MPFAASWDLFKRQRGMLPQILFYLCLGDAVSRHDFRILYAERNERRSAAETPHVQMTHSMVHCDDLGQRRKRLFTPVPGGLHRQKPADAANRDGALFRLKTHLDVIRLPRTLLFVIAEAHRVLPRPAERRTIGFART